MMYRFFKAQEETSLPLLVQMFGIHHEQEPINRPSGMFCWQWFYTAEGEGELIVSGQKFVLTEKQVFLIAPGEPHSYRARSEKWITHFIGFSGGICDPLMKELGMTESGIYQMYDQALFLTYLDKMLAIYNGQGSIIEKSYSYSTICYELLCRMSRDIRKVGQAEEATENEYITMAIRYLEAHFSENFALDELAEHVGLSKSYLCHLFHREMGESIVNYLKKQRLARAGFMLRHQPGMKIGEVALACGFETPSYFTKQFRRHYGVTPEAYRLGNQPTHIEVKEKNDVPI